MNLLSEIEKKTQDYLVGDYETYVPRGVPNPEDIPLGNRAAQLETTALFVDVRQSSDITNVFRRQTAAKMMKAYFDGAVRVINANEGAVRSFNGDGMLALFVGNSRSNNAVKAAMQLKWFVRDVLSPRFEKFFLRKKDALGNALDFNVGCGLDEGTVFAVRVGIKGTNDVSWVGRCTNTSSKLSNIAQPPKNVLITRAVYKRLNDDRKYSEGTLMWSNESFYEMGGVSRALRSTTYHWTIRLRQSL